MSLEKVIQFNVLLDTLSQDELDVFYSELTSACDKRELITKSLFHLLAHENKQNSSVYESNANRIVTNIIEKRNVDDPFALASSICAVSFDSLPSVVISQCASYLQLYELSSLLRCNRHSYVSCKSIPTMTSLFNADWFNNYCHNYGDSRQCQFAQMDKLHQFSRMKHLALWEADLSFLELHEKLQHWNWGPLDTLALFEIKFRNNLDDYDDKRILDIIAHAQIKHLQLQVSWLTMDKYFECVCSNTNIEYLTLMAMNLDTTILPAILTMTELSDGEILAPFSSLSKLKGIAFNETDLHQDHELRYIIANHLRQQLQSLHVHTSNAAYHDQRVPIHSWDNNDYSQLQELCASGINNDQVRHILKTATQLKRFHLSVDPSKTLVSREFTLQPFADVFEMLKMTLSRKSLQYLSIKTTLIMQVVLAIIYIIILDEEHETPKRKCFKLRLNTTDQFNRNVDGIAWLDLLTRPFYKDIPNWTTAILPGLHQNVLLSLVKMMERLVSSDFMLFIQCRSDSCFGEKMQNEMKGKQIEENYQTHLSKKMTKAPTYDERDAYISNTFEQMELAVCNRGNTMGGYKFTETWDMPCTHLDDIA